MSETSSHEFLEKKSSITEVGTEGPETPEQKQQKAEEEKNKAFENNSQTFYKGAQIEQVGGGSTYSRPVAQLNRVGQETAERSLLDTQNSKAWGNAPKEVQASIQDSYNNLMVSFNQKLKGIEQKYRAEPNQKAFENELFEAQKQFETDISKVAGDSNGKINAEGASKNAADSQEQKNSQEQLAKRTRDQFREGISQMIEQEQVLSTAARNNRMLAEARTDEAEAKGSLDLMFGHAAKSAPRESTQQVAMGK